MAGHRTSVALEDDFWQALTAIAARDGVALSALIARIDGARAAEVSLASALRVRALHDAHAHTISQKSTQDRAID